MVLTGQNGISPLLANVDPYAQQDNADAMIDFAKSNMNNEQALIVSVSPTLRATRSTSVAPHH